MLAWCVRISNYYTSAHFWWCLDTYHCLCCVFSLKMKQILWRTRCELLHAATGFEGVYRSACVWWLCIYIIIYFSVILLTRRKISSPSGLHKKNAVWYVFIDKTILAAFFVLCGFICISQLDITGWMMSY